MQARYEAAAVDLLAAAGPVREPDDVGAVLRQPGGKGEPLGVLDQRHEPGVAIGVVAHQHGQFAARFQRRLAVAEEHAVRRRKCSRVGLRDKSL